MNRNVRIVLYALAVLAGGAAMAWNWRRADGGQTKVEQAAASGAVEAAAPASRAIFPKVLNKQ